MIVGPISVALALSGREWRSSLQRHCRDYVADIAVQLVRDGRQALDPSISVVVLDDDTSWLSTPFLNGARERGIPVIGLYDPLESDGMANGIFSAWGLTRFCLLPSQPSSCLKP